MLGVFEDTECNLKEIDGNGRESACHSLDILYSETKAAEAFYTYETC